MTKRRKYGKLSTDEMLTAVTEITARGHIAEVKQLPSGTYIVIEIVKIKYRRAVSVDQS